MSSTSSTSDVLLTVTLQPTPSVISKEPYLYDDALYDARGYPYSYYSGSPQPHNNTLFLWESGCRTGEGWNCTLACSDSKAGRNMVWNSSEAMFTLHNCLVYPILATAASNGWLVQDPVDLLDKFRIEPNDMLIADTEAESGVSAWPVIDGCLQRLCAPAYGDLAADSCSGPNEIPTRWSAGSGDDLWEVSLTFDGTEDLCSSGNNLPNPDLGGPGVMLSIIQQIAILWAMWLLLSSAQWMRSVLNLFSKRGQSHCVQRLREVMEPGRQTDALLIALQEFQKTQIFLLLALQVVSLLALEHTTWLDAYTIPQLISNAIFMVLLSTAGVYPIILGLLTLRKSKGHLEWFTLTMSLACVVVSLVTWTKVSRIDLGEIQSNRSDLTFDECGGINPTKYCGILGINLRTYGLGDLYIFRQRLSTGPVCVMLYLVVEKALPIANRHNLVRTPKWATEILRKCPHCLVSAPSWLKTVLKTAVLLCAEAWLLWGNIMIFEIVLEVWMELSYEGKIWTIGQVIGVGVWIPGFLEWLYSALRGIEASFSIRLPGNYKVVKLDTENAVSSSNGASHTLQSTGQQSTDTMPSYEMLPNPTGDYHRVANPRSWTPA